MSYKIFDETKYECKKCGYKGTAIMHIGVDSLKSQYCVLCIMILLDKHIGPAVKIKTEEIV